jgi:hypothetical protein
MGMTNCYSSASGKYDSPTCTRYGLPNPIRYSVEGYEQHGAYLVVMVRYPDSHNYEGNKILVFRGVEIGQINHRLSLDPHFSDNPEHLSPIARFVPTEDGWHMANGFALLMSRATGA